MTSSEHPDIRLEQHRGWLAGADGLQPLQHQLRCRDQTRRRWAHVCSRVRGDKNNPVGQGYTCEKALRLDHYQNNPHRLTSPMRRRDDGTFEEVDWDTAIREVAAGLAKVRDEHGGETIFYYGGGGQGNHLPGGYSGATRKALGMKYSSNALAQEAGSGEFWVDGQLFGAMSCHHPRHGAHRLRRVPQESGTRTASLRLAPSSRRWRTIPLPLIIIDPASAGPAEIADIHLRVRPGGDAWLLGDAQDSRHRRSRRPHVPRRTGQPSRRTRGDARHRRPRRVGRQGRRAPRPDPPRHHDDVAQAESCAIFEDLGIQMAPHSTLNSYLEKLIFILTGNFGVKGGMNLHTAFGKLAGGGGGGDRRHAGRQPPHPRRPDAVQRHPR